MSGVFKAIKSIFGGGTKINVVYPTAPSESSNDTQEAMDDAAREQAERLARGRSATWLTGGAGLDDMGKTSKVLLGH